MPTVFGSAALASDDSAVIPIWLVDRLSLPELPAREVHPPCPDDCDLPSVSIDRDRLVADRPKPQRRNQAPLRRLAVARRAYSPPGTALDFGRIDTKKAQPLRAAVKSVAVNDIGAWTVEHCWMLPSGFFGCNMWEPFRPTARLILGESDFRASD